MKTFFKVLLLCSVCLCVSCNDTNEDNESTTSFNPDDYLYYITGKINGETFILGQRTNATTLDYSQPGFGNSITTPCTNPMSGLNYKAGVYPSLENEARPDLYFDFVRFYMCDPNFNNNPSGTFNDSFPIRNYETATSNSRISGTTGAVSLFYAPDATDNLQLYNSLNEDQSGNFFEITSSTNNNTFAQRIQTIEGVFSFKVYNENDSSDFIEITDGEFKLDVFFD